MRGNVLLKNERQGDNSWLTARVTDGTKELLRPLIKAQVLKVFHHGMVIDGIEVVARSTSENTKVSRHCQVWWVFVWTDEAINRYEGEDPLESLADAQRFGCGAALGV